MGAYKYIRQIQPNQNLKVCLHIASEIFIGQYHYVKLQTANKYW